MILLSRIQIAIIGSLPLPHRNRTRVFDGKGWHYRQALAAAAMSACVWLDSAPGNTTLGLKRGWTGVTGAARAHLNSNNRYEGLGISCCSSAFGQLLSEPPENANSDKLPTRK